MKCKLYKFGRRIRLLQHKGNVYYTNKVRVFNWDGENRFEIRTDYPLKRIAVDEDDNFLYDLSKEDEAIIVRFNLQDIN